MVFSSMKWSVKRSICEVADQIKTVVIPLVALFLAATGCDGPTKPEPVSPEYYFYGIDALDSRRLLRFDPTTCDLDTIGDTVYRSNSVTVAADGKQVFVSTGTALHVRAARTGNLLKTVDFPSLDAACSPDGKYLASIGYGRQGLLILALPEYQEIYRNDSLPVGTGPIFSQDSKTLYCRRWTDPNDQVWRIRLEPTISIGTLTTPLSALRQAVPSVDEKLLFLYSIKGSSLCAFGVYDIEANALIYATDLYPGFGWIEVSPDGESVFFTNPGTIFTQSGPSAFYIYDIPTNTVREISTVGIASGPEEPDLYEMPIGPLAVTPNGMTLVLTRAIVGLDLIIYDVQEEIIIKYCHFGNDVGFHDISCQTGK